MTDGIKLPVEKLSGNDGGKNKIGKKSKKTFLIIALCVLVAALIVAAVLLLGAQDRIVRVLDYGTVLDGVSVDGIDISGMTSEEAMAATADIHGGLLGDVDISIDINGEEHHFKPEALGISTDYEDVIAAAIKYGHAGTFDERKTAAVTAKNDGVDFAVDVTADEQTVTAALTTLKDELDTAPKDATFTFMPSGYYMVDGVAYDALEYEAMLEEQGTDIEEAGLQRVMLDVTEQPNSLRYQYWHYDEFDDENIPKDAYVARFYYTEEVTGMVIDTEAVKTDIIDAVANDDFTAMISAPVTLSDPTVTLEQIKNQTQLVASWTSSYYKHRSTARNFNVAKLSGIINGVEILPGEEWSINEQAGPRYSKYGWKTAAGISGGAFTPQVGGGVCQLSSTTYNAAIRTGLTIVEKSNHSIISDYIMTGLDATISTGSPDLVLGNPYETSVYIVSYVNPDGYNVTVEMYGVPVVDEKYGDVILDFSSRNERKGPEPATIDFYGFETTPQGDSIPVGGSVEYVKPRRSTTIDAYKHILNLNGEELEEVFFETVKYPSYTGKRYWNTPDPALATPTPDPAQSPGSTENPPATTVAP